MNPHPIPPQQRRRAAVPQDPMADVTMPRGYGARDRGPGKSIQYRLDDPRVCAYMARVIIKNNMNFDAAVAATSPKKLTDEQIASQAHVLRRSPRVQEEIQKLFAEIGIDDGAFKKYYSVLWEWTLGDNPRLKVAAAKLLGSIFGINEKADESKKPAKLQIEGIEEGLKAMGVLPSASPTGFGKIDEGDEDD